MKRLTFSLILKVALVTNILTWSIAFADNHNIYETLELIKKDIKTLEKAVYSNSTETSTGSLNTTNSNTSEDVLTRHLLKLTEIENQFQDLTNRFEEINFKLDKLSNRLSKVQADNQIRFQDIENAFDSNINIDSSTKKLSKNDNKVLQGSSEPQDLGSVSYKDNETQLEEQQIQSIDTTGTVVTETFPL